MIVFLSRHARDVANLFINKRREKQIFFFCFFLCEKEQQKTFEKFEGREQKVIRRQFVCRGKKIV